MTKTTDKQASLTWHPRYPLTYRLVGAAGGGMRVGRAGGDG
ncbi:hypothetical protein I553_4300 [Mycobacterium xenopi 4042]|uniref:Uncharacterized protein n=1 Tax=Mycobacterium xenopi 4042 TaxID=1299334 RepID=X8AET4_MYCXE|nr:hypothetical protein I553_4300 [Mycobacterium xenopi 4042]EUA50737.1 hypothetical protein I552_1677 [Mycobacterium xenopi 3993]